MDTQNGEISDIAAARDGTKILLGTYYNEKEFKKWKKKRQKKTHLAKTEILKDRNQPLFPLLSLTLQLSRPPKDKLNQKNFTKAGFLHSEEKC